MIKNIIIMTMMAVITLSASYLMIPRPKEIALMQLKSKDFDTAQASYEVQIEKGDYSISVAVPLSEVYLHQGDIDRAIDLMEKFLDQHPGHVTGLQRLAQYFKEAQKPHGQAQVLTQVVDLNRDRDVLRELAGRHDLLANSSGVATALAHLVETHEATIYEYDRLARYQASNGHLQQAISTLSTLMARHGDTADPASIVLLASLKLDLGDTLGAIAGIQEKLEARKIDGLAVTFAAIFAEKRRPDLALRVLRPQLERFPDDVDLLAATVQYESRMGNSKAALQRLKDFAKTRSLPNSLSFDLIVLLLTEDAPDEAMTVLQNQDPARIPEWLARNILARSVELHRPDLPAKLAAFLGDTYFADHPIVAAQVFAAMDDKEEATVWIKWAEQKPSLLYRDQLVLARLYYDVNQPELGLDLIERLAAQNGSGGTDIASLADLYLSADLAGDGLSVFQRLRKTRPGPDTDAAWARLAAKSRRAGPVMRWINATPDIAPNVLEEIFHSAERNRQTALAVTAVERLHQIRPGPGERRLHARAYAAAGRARESEAIFARLIDERAELDRDDLAALSLIGANDHLETYWTARLDGGNEDDGNRLVTMFTGVRQSALRLVLPRLEKLARSKGGFWLATYVESARMAGDVGRLKDFLKAEAERPDLSMADSRKVATALFDVAPGDSVKLFARLASSNPEAWGDAYMDTLLALNRTAELVQFLKLEVARPGISRTKLDRRLFTLIELAPGDSLQVLASAAAHDPDVWSEVYIHTLAAQGRTTELVQFLKSEVDRPGIARSVRVNRVYALIDAGGPEAAVGPLAQLANSEGGNWASAYEEALTNLGQDDVLYDYLAAKANSDDIGPEERTGIAFRLLDGGRKDDAERNFFILASNAGPDTDAVRQLLHLWGPRPEPHQLNWLEQRATASNGKDRAAWLTYLSERGAEDRVIGMIEANPPPLGIDGLERKVYLNAIVTQRDAVRLRKLIREELATGIKAGTARHLAKLAVQENLQDVATEAYGVVLKLRPADSEAAGWLGRVAYAQGRRADALRLIALSMGKDSDDFEVHYIYGELLYADERRSEALPHLHRALELIEAAPHKTVEMRLAMGQSLFRLGRADEAIAVYAKLHAERSDDPAIRADYGSLLIDARDFDRARAVLWTN